MQGQISMFDLMEADPIRTPCGRRCKHEWGSRNCFEERGQMYNWHERKWVRDENGKILIGKGPVIGNQRRKEHEKMRD